MNRDCNKVNKYLRGNENKITGLSAAPIYQQSSSSFHEPRECGISLCNFLLGLRQLIFILIY